MFLFHTWYQTASLANTIFSLRSSMAPSFLSSQPTAFNYQLPIKLNRDNYLSWKFLILPHAKGHDLLGFLDGTLVPPAVSLSLPDGSSVPNPDYHL
jgi:gag-polypeptide of LTR copia-type